MLMKRLQRCPGPAAHPWLCPPLGHCAPHSDQRCLSVHAAKPEASWQLSQHESGSAVGPRSPCQPSTSGRVAWHPRTMRPYSTAPSQRDVTTQASSRSSGSDPAPAAVASTQPAASSPQGAQQQSSQQPAQSRVVRYSPLHYNVEDFVQRIELSEDERKQKQNIVDIVRTQTRRAMLDAGRECQVVVFGSFATGLSTWSSDVDLVVTGIMEPDRYSGVYDMSDRGRVVGRLRRIGEALRRCKKLDNPRISIIPRARIPIIKLKVRHAMIDISIGDDTGPRVARYMAQQVRAWAPMRPLVLVLKTYLRTMGLNEVVHGGLSSYSLSNMVIAHLQEEMKAGRDIYDLGESLYAFLLRYGEEFDYNRDAVSVESGGIVKKHALGMAGEARGGYAELDRYYERLAVDCPVTGRDVSNGTYRVDAVRQAFQRAARRLEALAQGRKPNDMTVNYLQALFDVNRVVKRSANPDIMDYEDDFVRVMGKGTSPEIIQIGRNDDYEEEELLGDTSDTSDLSFTSVGEDSWDEYIDTAGPGGTNGMAGGAGKGGRNKGGPRGKGPRN